MDTLNGETPQQPTVPPADSSVSTQTAAASNIMSADPNLMRDLNSQFGPPTTTPNPTAQKPGMLSRFWQTTKRALSVQGLKDSAGLITGAENNVTGAIGRGVLKGADELSNSAVQLARSLPSDDAKAMDQQHGLASDAFLHWFDEPSGKDNPIQFGEDRINRWLGPSQGGAMGFIENASQFAFGMATVGRALGGTKAVSALGAAGKAGEIAASALKGAAVDATTFDAHMQRLSNMIQNGPSWMHNPVTAYLAADKDDGELKARIKAGLEGSVLGSTIDSIMEGLSGIRAKMRGNTEEAVAAMQKATSPEPRADEPYAIQQTDDGQFAVTHRGEVLAESPTYTSQGQAENVSATMNYVTKNEAIRSGSLDEETVANIRKAMNEYAKNPETRDFGDLLDSYGVNFRYVQSPEDVKGVIKSIVDNAPEASTVARGRPRTWAETAKESEDIFKGMSGDDVVQHAAKYFDSTEGLDSKILAMRTWMQGHANEVKRLARAADANPDNALAHDQLAASLETMYNFHAEFTGTNANVARALAINKMPVGEAMEAAKAGTKRAPEELTQQADKLGAEVDPKALEKEATAAGEKKPSANGGPNTETVTDAADMVGQKGEGEAQPIEKQGLNDGTRDTQGVNANDFSRARARQAAVNALKKAQAVLGDPVDEAVKADNRSLRGERVKMQGDLQKESPLETPQEGAASTGPKNPIEDLSRMMDEADARLTQELEKANKAPEPKQQGQKLPEEVSPVSTRIQEVKRAQQELQQARTMLQQLKSGDITEGSAGAPLGPSQLRSNAGAGPYAEQDPLQGPSPIAPKGRNVTDGLTKAELRALTRSIFMTDGDPAGMLSILRGPGLAAPRQLTRDPEATSKWMQYATGYRMEAMLSGPKTHVGNAVSNMLAAFQRPMEYWWGGAKTFNPELRQMGSDMLTGLFQSWGDSWTAAKKAFLSGDNVLDKGNMGTGVGNLGDVSYLSKIYHAPSRFLMSADEMFTQMNYRANMRAQILRQARDEGITDPKQLGDRLTSDMQFAFDPQGGAVNPLALQYARVSTFKNALNEGTVGRWLQSGAQQLPIVRVIAPFIRTPTNIFRYTWERTPGLNFAMKTFRDDYFGSDPELKAIAQAKLDMGLATYGTAAMLAHSGQITGAGPTDPHLRAQWKDAGHQPYSLKIPGTDRWVSYRRLSPTFAPLGLVADIFQMSGEMHDEDLKTVAASAIASIMANVTNQTYNQGIAQFFDAVSSGNGSVVSEMANETAGSFMPNVLNQAKNDDTIRETRGFIDEMKSRLPGFSQTLEPRRNLLGEKVMMPPGAVNRVMNPFTVSAPAKDQNVQDELLKLGKSFDMPATTKFDGTVLLTDRDRYDNGTHQSPYDRMLETMSDPPNGMPSLRTKLTDFVNSDEYKRLSVDKRISVGGEKWNAVNSIIQAYQQMSWGTVQKEYPKLQEAEKQFYQEKAASMTGGTASVDSVMKTFDHVLATPHGKHVVK